MTQSKKERSSARVATLVKAMWADVRSAEEQKASRKNVSRKNVRQKRKEVENTVPMASMSTFFGAREPAHYVKPMDERCASKRRPKEIAMAPVQVNAMVNAVPLFSDD